MLIDTKEAARRLGLSTPRVIQLLREGRIVGGQKVGGQRGIWVVDVPSDAAPQVLPPQKKERNPRRAATKFIERELHQMLPSIFNESTFNILRNSPMPAYSGTEPDELALARIQQYMKDGRFGDLPFKDQEWVCARLIPSLMRFGCYPPPSDY